MRELDGGQVRAGTSVLLGASNVNEARQGNGSTAYIVTTWNHPLHDDQYDANIW